MKSFHLKLIPLLLLPLLFEANSAQAMSVMAGVTQAMIGMGITTQDEVMGNMDVYETLFHSIKKEVNDTTHYHRVRKENALSTLLDLDTRLQAQLVYLRFVPGAEGQVVSLLKKSISQTRTAINAYDYKQVNIHADQGIAELEEIRSSLK